MSPLRNKMIEAMRMRGFSARTHETYLRGVSELARYYRRCPSTLNREELEAYFRHLVLERELSPSSCRVYLNAVRFLYLRVLEHTSFDVCITIPKRPQRIPELLSREEVGRILSQCHRNPKHRTLLTTCYGCGLRVSELVKLKVNDIDGERKQLRVEQGKGAKDRMVILSAGLLTHLRGYWQLYRPRPWLFPGHRPDVALGIDTAQHVFQQAKARAGVEKVGGIHALRHAYATHQLDSGLPVHILQRLLGHQSLRSTLRYVHWLPSYRDAGSKHGDLVSALETVR